MLALAQIGGLTIVHWVIIAIAVIAVMAIFAAYIKASGLQVPEFAVTVFWIVVCAVIAIVGIIIVLRVAGMA
jgi:hypothetical protein